MKRKRQKKNRATPTILDAIILWHHTHKANPSKKPTPNTKTRDNTKTTYSKYGTLLRDKQKCAVKPFNVESRRFRFCRYFPGRRVLYRSLDLFWIFHGTTRPIQMVNRKREQNKSRCKINPAHIGYRSRLSTQRFSAKKTNKRKRSISNNAQ